MIYFVFVFVNLSASHRLATTRNGTTPTVAVEFTTAVEKGKKVKDRIRKLYSEVFTDEKLRAEAEYANNVLQSSATPVNLNRRTGMVAVNNPIMNSFAVP
jgi:phage-related tail fiber protein